jgi:hypothetical protein
MKKIITLFCIQFITLNGFSQVAFTSSDCFSLGDTSAIGYETVAINFNNERSNTGYNHTWDYSTTNWGDGTGSYVFQAGSKSSHSLLQNTQINEYALTTISRDAFYNYNNNKDTLTYVGVYTGGNSYRSFPGITYLTFPLNYGDSVGKKQNQYSTAALTTVAGNSTRSYKYDGFGTLKRPNATYNNVFRISTWQLDSTIIGNFKFGTSSEEIIWFQQGGGVPLLRMIKGAGYVYVYYSSPLQNTTSLGEIKNSDIQVFPNPFNDIITLQGLVENSSVKIFDAMGKTLYFNPSAANTIQTENLSTGVYYLEIINAGERSIVKMVK